MAFFREEKPPAEPHEMTNRDQTHEAQEIPREYEYAGTDGQTITTRICDRLLKTVAPAELNLDHTVRSPVTLLNVRRQVVQVCRAPLEMETCLPMHDFD